MRHIFRYVASILVAVLCLSGTRAAAADGSVSRSEMNLAVSEALTQDAAARSSVKALLHRDEFRTVAEAYGLDYRRAEAAVGTLNGEDLRRVSALAAQADSQLAGGAQRVSISLVALLLIIIIVILVAN